jgi:hypothetical protein
MSKEKPISKDLDRLLGIYESMRPEDAENCKFVLALQRLIANAAVGGDQYDAERAEEWREIAYALGDNDPDCSGMGHWSGEVKKHAPAIHKIILEDLP